MWFAITLNPHFTLFHPLISTSLYPMKNRFLKFVAIGFLCLAGPNGTWTAQAESASAPATWDQIVAQATQEKKPIVLEFTGSDWCPPCKMMNKEVFSTPEFKKFAESDLVFVKVDFPRSKELSAEETARNEALAQKFQIEGFPTLVVLDPAGEELTREVGFMQGGPQAFISWVKKATE